MTAFGYTNGFLTSVTDPDGAVSRYTYDTGKSLMLTAKDPYGYQVQYAYGSIAPYRVSKVTEYAGSTEGQSLALAYGHNRTSFTDNKGRKEVYLFDHAGRIVSVRNDAGYGASWQYLDTTKYKNRLSAATDLRFVSPQYLRGVTGGITEPDGHAIRMPAMSRWKTVRREKLISAQSVSASAVLRLPEMAQHSRT